MRHSERKLAGWDPIADWYDGWVGPDGSEHHQRLAIPAVLDLLDLQPGEHVLDIGCGQGVLAPYIARQDACYTGVEISPRLLSKAKQRHGHHGRFLQGDARHLDRIPALKPRSFDAAVFLLSIQDIDPLDQAIASAASMLRDEGRLVMLLTHPCFRVPRQSGWGYDSDRQLKFRRVDRYLKPLTVPMKAYSKQQGSGVSISFHRPLSHYINALGACGLFVDALDELTTYKAGTTRADQTANDEIPLFIGLRAWKLR